MGGAPHPYSPEPQTGPLGLGGTEWSPDAAEQLQGGVGPGESQAHSSLGSRCGACGTSCGLEEGMVEVVHPSAEQTVVSQEPWGPGSPGASDTFGPMSTDAADDASAPPSLAARVGTASVAPLTLGGLLTDSAVPATTFAPPFYDPRPGRKEGHCTV